jgi:hypothetical protein
MILYCYYCDGSSYISSPFFFFLPTVGVYTLLSGYILSGVSDLSFINPIRAFGVVDSKNFITLLKFSLIMFLLLKETI